MLEFNLIRIVVGVLLIAAPFYLLFIGWLLYLKFWADDDNRRWSVPRLDEPLELEEDEE